MLSAAFKALGDIASPEFRSVLLKAAAMTVGLFIVVFFAVEFLISMLTLLPWPWAETVLAVGTGLALFALFFFLMAPVTAIFAGLFLDDIAARVEQLHYPRDSPGRPLGTAQAMTTALQFAFAVLLVNLAVLPTIFMGIGAFALVAANAYLISREYFEMIAMRHMAIPDARVLRKENTPRIFVAGFVPAFLTLIPLVNIAVPLFATAYFVHIFKQVSASSA